MEFGRSRWLLFGCKFVAAVGATAEVAGAASASGAAELRGLAEDFARLERML